MSALRKLASETLWYGASSILGRMVNYLLVPFYTSRGVLEPEEYGAVGELFAYVAFLNILYTFGFETTYFRYANRQDEKKIFSQAISWILLLGSLLSGGLALLATPLVNYMGYTTHEEYIYLLAALMLVDALWAIPFARLRFLHRARYFALLKTGSILLNVLLNIFFLWICRLAYEGQLPSMAFLAAYYSPEQKVTYIFLANLLANAFLFFPLFPILRDFRWQLDPKLLLPMLYYAIPLVFIGFAGQISGLADRWFIKYYMPTHLYPQSNQYILGIYNACVKFAVFILLYVQAFRYASEPFYFSKSAQPQAAELFARVLDWFVLVGCLLTLGVVANLDWLKWLLIRNPAYHDAIDIVPILLISNLLLGIYFNVGIWYKITDKTWFGTYFTILGAVVTIAGNLLLVPLFGYMGSTYASLIAALSMLITCYRAGQRYYPIPYRWKFIFVVLTYTFVAAQAIVQYNTSQWQGIFLKNLPLLLLLGLVGYLARQTQHTNTGKSKI